MLRSNYSKSLLIIKYIKLQNTLTLNMIAEGGEEFEEAEQDKKRKIRLLDPNFVDKFVDEFKVLMKESII